MEFNGSSGDTYLELYRAADRQLNEVNDVLRSDANQPLQMSGYTRNLAINAEPAMKWQEAALTADMFLAWTEHEDCRGAEEAFTTQLQQQKEATRLNVHDYDDRTPSFNGSVDRIRRGNDPHYNVMRTAEETENTMIELEETLQEYHQLLGAHEDGEFSASAVADAVDPALVQRLYHDATASLDTLLERASSSDTPQLHYTDANSAEDGIAAITVQYRHGLEQDALDCLQQWNGTLKDEKDRFYKRLGKLDASSAGQYRPSPA